MNIKEKIVLLSKIVMPQFWRKYYKNNHMKGATKYNNVYNEWAPIKINLGDNLGNVIIPYMLKRCEGNGKKTKVKSIKHLMTVGSILHADFFDTTVWGSGCLNINSIPIIKTRAYHRKMDIRAVRGPLTRRVLQACGYNVPEIFGDPAILLPDIYNPNKKKEYDISLVFHFRYARSLEDYHCISIQTYDYKKFIDEVIKSRKIISSEYFNAMTTPC